MGRPPPQILGGTVPTQSPLGLRPCSCRTTALSSLYSAAGIIWGSISLSTSVRYPIWAPGQGHNNSKLYSFNIESDRLQNDYKLVNLHNHNHNLRYLPNGAWSQFHHLLNTVLFRLPGSRVPLSRDYLGHLEVALHTFILIDWLKLLQESN